MHDDRLAGQIIAITGAASGIGLAVAHACAAAGARLALLDRDGPALERAEAALDAEDVLGVVVDIGEPSSVANAFAAISTRFGALHGLFNNAGVAPVNVSERVEDISDATWAFALQVNLTGCFLCCREAMGLIESSGGGSIINNASTAALVAEPGLEAYSAAKGGVLALTRALAVSSAHRGVRLNAVCPGLLQTPMTSDIGSQVVARLQADTLLEVPGPEAISGLIVYLLSGESQYMTGSVVVIDGGLTSR
ncbi:MAG TPA: SDR family NAD(P)-dependent oxidoreductase [Jatrophihabitantaceae bacterium]|jgi:NAD(P)-dependent dehydrogenase (short-subunit alcohol dehydrogenase family)